MFGDIFEEGAHSRKLATCRRCAEPLGAALGKKCTKIAARETKQVRSTDRFPQMPPEKVDEPMGRRPIGPNGVGRTAAVMLEIGRPTRGVGAGRVA